LSPAFIGGAFFVFRKTLERGEAAQWEGLMVRGLGIELMGQSITRADQAGSDAYHLVHWMDAGSPTGI